MFPVASRVVVIVLSWLSPVTESKPLFGEKLALIAIVMVLESFAAALIARWLLIGRGGRLNAQPQMK
jgi:hypothetical protein